jgi:hypothetical protein
MLGYVVDVAFMNIKTDAVPGLSWRIMLASAYICFMFGSCICGFTRRQMVSLNSSCLCI